MTLNGLNANTKSAHIMADVCNVHVFVCLWIQTTINFISIEVL